MTDTYAFYYQIAKGILPPKCWDTPPQKADTFEFSSGIYRDAAKEIFSKFVIGKESYRDVPVTVRIWDPEVLPEYGPYCYSIYYNPSSKEPVMFQTELWNLTHIMEVA